MSDGDQGKPLLVESGELTERIAFLEGIARKSEDAETALLESEKRYRRLFESAKDGIMILDALTGIIVDVNPFLVNLLGFTHEGMCGKFIWELGAFSDIAASKEAFRVLQDNEYIRYEDLPLVTSEGKPIDVEFVSNVYLVDNRKVIQCNIRDITARKRNEAERNRLLAAINQVGEVIMMTDPEGNIEFVNPAFERSTGYTRQEAIGKNPRMLKSGEQDEAFYKNMWEQISGGNTWAGRMVTRRKDGSTFTEEATISPVRDSSGKIVNFVAVKHDITENLKLEAKFLQAQKMESIGLLAGGVAHDYNNMLTVITGYTELALSKIDPSHPLFEDLVEIFKAASRSIEVTRQLLTFARKQSIAPVILDMNQAVDGSVKMLRRLIGENVNLVWEHGEAPLPVKLDPIQIVQILANLCVNSKDAMNGSGNVTILTGSVDLGEGFCALHQGCLPGKYVFLKVRDDGSGMTKEVLDQVFEPFYTTKAVGRGTGLGLSMVYGIVKQNQGLIYAESEPGKGTVFSIYFPRQEFPVFAAPKDKVDELPQNKGETVLVVDDEPAILGMTKLLLENLGYRVLSAMSPGEALALSEMHKGEISLLLTDVIMPTMNGWELARKVAVQNPGIKQMFMSGFSADIIPRSKDGGIINFIQKPFSVKALATMVSEVLRQPSQALSHDLN